MAIFSEIGRRLRVARAEKAVSIEVLSGDAAVSVTELERLERGEPANVSTAALARIARRLGLRDTDLWTKEEPASLGLFFRHGSVPDFFSKDAEIARDALRVAEAVRLVEDLIGRTAPLREFFDAEPVRSPAYQNGYELAHQARRALHLKGALPSEIAPLPAEWDAIIEHFFGFPILERDLATRSVLAFTAKATEPKLAAIVLNGWSRQPALSRRVTIAHELSHAVFDPVQRAGVFIDREEDFSDRRSEGNEQRARAFAAELLVPRAGLLQLLGPPDPTKRGVTNAAQMVARAGVHFGSTVELTAYHLANNRYFDDALHDEVVQAVSPWEYGDPPPREPLLVQRVRQGLEAGAISEGRARELLGLSAWDPLPGTVR